MILAGIKYEENKFFRVRINGYTLNLVGEDIILNFVKLKYSFNFPYVIFLDDLPYDVLN